MPNILIVPNDLLPKEHRESLLTRRSLKIQDVPSAKEALSIAKKWRPELIIFSSQLSEISVGEFCKFIRTDPELQQTKLLMLTDQIGERTDDLGDMEIDGHLVNPVDGGQLYSTIAGILNIRMRRAPRVKVDLIAQIDLLAKDKDCDITEIVRILNLSETGLLLESPVFMALGSLCRVVFSLPEDHKRLSLFCIVRVLANEILMRYGVELLGVNNMEKDQLRSVVHKKMANKAQPNDRATTMGVGL